METVNIDELLDISPAVRHRSDSSDDRKDINAEERIPEEVVKHSMEQAFFEYLCFLQNLPILIKSERARLINLVKTEFHIDQISISINKLDFRKLSKLKDQSSMLNEFSRKIGRSLKILGPPTTKCLLCDETLTLHHPPSHIAVHGPNGPEVYSKYILRCRQCKLKKGNKFKAMAWCSWSSTSTLGQGQLVMACKEN